MKLVRRGVTELYHLFVDDGADAAIVVAWIAFACLALRAVDAGPWGGPILFAGLAALFLGSLRPRR